MPKIEITNFRASNHALEPTEIAVNEAVWAFNCKLDNGVLEGERGLGSSVATLASSFAQSIYWFNREGNSGDGYWFQWDEDVDVVRGPIADDDYLRTYWTGEAVPRFTTFTLAQGANPPYPSASRVLGLQEPGTFTASGPSTEPYEDTDGNGNPITVDPTDGSPVVSTAYVMTYVSDLGEEGPPSLPTAVVDRFDGGQVVLSNLPTPSGGAFSAKRLYRAELNGVFQFVAELNPSMLNHVDSKKSAELGEPLPSEGWIAPHEDMIGLTALPNGILMGWWDNTLAFSHPYQPHAWPIEYRLALDHNIVGAAVTAAGVIVVTDGPPYMVSGSAPGSMSQHKMDISLPCVSKNSVVDMGEYAIYASSDGLVAIGGNHAELISGRHISSDWWRMYLANASTIKACRWKGRYLGFFEEGGGITAFTYHPNDGLMLYPDTGVQGLWHDRATDDVYVVVGNQVRKWGDGLDGEFIWNSKEFVIPPGQVFTCAKIDVGNNTFAEFTYYLGNTVVKVHEAEDSKPFRLPAMSRYNRCRFKVEGIGKVRRIQLATTMSELT